METQQMNVRVLGCAAVAALMVLAASTRASAQSNDEVFPQFQFNFSTPGARANAMGGTFIGIADDSSASITNPAGLVRLTRKQVYFEFKATSLEVDRLSAVDSLFTLEPTTSGETTSTPAFLSFSMPVGERFAVAFTRHQFLNYREDFTLAPRPIPLSGFVFFGVDGETDFSAVSYAVSAAMTVNPKLRVGVTLSRDSMSANSVATRFAHESTDSNDQFALRQLPLIVNETSIDDSASGMSATFGALILPNEKVSIGVQFAKGASFELEESLRQNPSDDVNDPLEMVEGPLMSMRLF